MTPEVVTVGEPLIRYSVPAGERLESASALHVGVAGAELNVAVAVSRMGRRAAWIGALPANPLGERVHRELLRHGVDCSGIVWSDDARMGTYYIEHARSPRPTEVVYDRADSATARLDSIDVDWTHVEQAKAVHLSGITPAISAKGAALADRVVEVTRGGGGHLVFDVNHREKLWSAEEAANALSTYCTAADTVIIGEEDARDLFGVRGSADQALEALQARFDVANLILTRGGDGCVYALGESVGGCEAFEVDVIDGIGAGDAFAAGVILGVLDGDIAAGVETGTAMAALVLGIEGDLFQFAPTDVAALVDGHSRSIRR